MSTMLHTRAPVWIGTDQPRGGVLGLLPELSRDALGLLVRCRREYGDCIRLRLGLTRFVLASHPELVEEVLVTRNHDVRKNVGARRLGSVLGSGLLVSEGDLWLRQRRLMQPAFHRQRIDVMAESIVSVASRTLDTWRAGETRAIYQELADLSLQIVARTLFGTDLGQDLARIRWSSLTMTAHLRSRLFSPMMLMPDRVPTPGNLRYAAAIRDLDALVFRLIAARRTARGGADRSRRPARRAR